MLYRSSWLLVLAGCPYIFDEPDTSNVDDDKPSTSDDDDDGDADTDTDVDSDTDVDTDTDGDADAPEVLSFTVSPRMNGIVLRFELDDDEENLEGGSIEVSNGSDEWTIQIPGGIDDWNPGAPSEDLLALDNEWLFPGLDAGTPDCAAGSDLTWTLTAVDDADHRSVPASERLVVAGAGIVVEPDYPVMPALSDPPFVICGEFPQAGEFGRSNDLDLFSFVTPEAGTYWIELEWQKTADMDFYVYTQPGGEIAIPNTYSYGYGFEFGLLEVDVAGTEWLGQVDYFEAPLDEPPYVGRLLITPE